MKNIFLLIFILCGLGVHAVVAQEESTDTSVTGMQTDTAGTKDAQDEEIAAAAEDIQRGKTLFTNNCKACHQLETRLVGPPLLGVTARREHEWLVKFIKSSQSVIQSGDSVAVALFNEYNKVIMPDQPLTEDEIDDVLAYISAGGQIPGEEVAANRISRPLEAPTTSLRPMKFSDYRFWLLFTVTVLLLIAVVYFKAETDELKEKIAESKGNS